MDKELYSLLDSRGEVYRRSANRSRLVTLAKTKVTVEESVSPMLIDLESLIISDLKQLLDQRGIMYYSTSTKHDLIGAVNISGPVTTEAFNHMKQMGEPKIGPIHELNAFNIEETVEKHNDSIFLINILPPRLKSSYFNESSWKALRRKLTYMDFKFGELDCDFEKRICLKRKWNISTLYLHTPGKENVAEYYIRDDYNIHRIFTSIQTEINYRITLISSWDTFTSSKWAFYRGSKDKIAVRVILFTNMTVPPMFVSSLSVKYREKVNFGMVNMESNTGRRILRKLKQKYWPLLLVVTKQGILSYGKLPGEYFTYRELDFFLSTLLQDFRPTEKWYHKLSIVLDPTWIGLLIANFVVRNMFMNGIRNEEGNQGNQQDADDVDNN
ncbi:E3 ubiquitin-protein ligase RNF103 [Mytilus galloprovincialis]|nr:E3 ubiquitin-protein ligase RNF103 [Mytilus galloprovincialis]